MKPKFEIKDTVKLLTPTLYDENEGVIVAIEKVYQECFSDGFPDPDGLHIRESDVESIQLPHSLKKNVLVIDYGDRKKTYKFLDKYAYTIDTPKMRSIYPEIALILIMDFKKKFAKPLMLKDEWIKNHFIINPDWKAAFEKSFDISDTNKMNYLQRAYDVFLKNGYSFKEMRPYKGKKLSSIVEIEFYKNDEWQWGQQENESQAFENVLSEIITSYEVDFQNLNKI